MIYTKDHKTLNMFEPFAQLGAKRLKLMEQSWAKLFREEILPELPVHRIIKHYDAFQGRPTKELYAMLGLLLLQEMLDLTDQEAVEQFSFNLQWHYALNITSDSDREAYVCPRTLWTMRSLLTEQGLYAELFETITDKLRKIFNVETDNQRLDSMHIFSNMRHLSRIGLFVRTIKKFLINLKRHHKALFEALDDTIKQRYLSRQGDAVFAMVKPSESAKTLEGLGEDLLLLVQRFSLHEAIVAMHSYQLLQRLLKEQCLVEKEPGADVAKVSVKPNKEVPSDSLQSPSDPESGYDSYKGRGYQVQVMETYAPEGSDEKDQLNLITYVHAEAAHCCDSQALQPAIEDAQRRQMAPKVLLADSHYGSDDNCQKAQDKGVTVVAPASGKAPQSSLTLADFSYCAKGRVTACPQQHAPFQTKHKKQRHSAAFRTELCGGCPHRDACPVKPGKHGYYLRYDDKDLRIAQRKAYEKTGEFRNLYRMRAGAEATMSEYDRKTGVKKLRIRGLSKVSYCATLKAAGINILRATAYRNRKRKEVEGRKQGYSGHWTPILSILRIVKEPISAFQAQLAVKLGNFRNRLWPPLQMAA